MTRLKILALFLGFRLFCLALFWKLPEPQAEVQGNCLYGRLLVCLKFVHHRVLDVRARILQEVHILSAVLQVLYKLEFGFLMLQICNFRIRT